MENEKVNIFFFFFKQAIGPSCHNIVQDIWRIPNSRPTTPVLYTDSRRNGNLIKFDQGGKPGKRREDRGE